MLVPLSIAYWPEQMPSLGSWLAAAALGILCTGAALLIYFELLHVVGATRAHVSGLTSSRSSAFSGGWLFLGRSHHRVDLAWRLVDSGWFCLCLPEVRRGDGTFAKM